MVLMTNMNKKKIIKSINSSCIPRVTPDSRYRHIKEFYSFQITLAITILLHDTKKVIKFYDPPAQLVLRSCTPADLAANRKHFIDQKTKILEMFEHKAIDQILNGLPMNTTG